MTLDASSKKPAPARAEGRPASRAKKPYGRPRLTEYGSVAKLTQSSAGSGADGGSKASQMMTCL
jgi:hypothetical protein